MGEALSDLLALHPSLRKHLFPEDGKLRRFVNVYLYDEGIRCMAKDTTPVKKADMLSTVPWVAGGC